MDFKYLLEKETQEQFTWVDILLIILCIPIGYLTVVLFFCL